MKVCVCIIFLLTASLSGWQPVNAILGVDLSTPTSQSAFSCLKNQGYDFVIVRAYHSFGSPDKNAVISIANAKAAGISLVDVYMFPCPKCLKSAKDQVNEMGMCVCGVCVCVCMDYGLPQEVACKKCLGQ